MGEGCEDRSERYASTHLEAAAALCYKRGFQITRYDELLRYCSLNQIQEHQGIE
jgi:hypothetical protein